MRRLVTGAVIGVIALVRRQRKALAVTGLKRSYLAPELPTLDESGVPGFEIYEWNLEFCWSSSPSI